MGSFDPVSTAMFALSVVDKQRQAKAQQRAVRAEADHEIATMRRQQEIRDRKRAETLRRAQATQRARFGAQGLGASGGSAQAVLDGFAAVSARDRADEMQGLDQRVSDINANLRNLKRRNLLERNNMLTNYAFGEIRKRLPVISLLEQ